MKSPAKPFALILSSILIGLSFSYSAKVVNAQSNGIAYKRYVYATGATSDYTLYNASMMNNSNPSRSYSFPDNRVEDDDTSVVKLTYQSRNGNGILQSYTGTGFIVDDNVIATCAHCVYNRDSYNPNGTYGMFNINYSIKIYGDDFTQPLDVFYPVSAHVPTKFINSNSEPEYSSFEYALLYLGDNVDLSSYGIFNLGVANDDFLENSRPVRCSGFPGLVNGGTNTAGKRYISEGYMGEFDVQSSINAYAQSCAQRFHATTVISGGDSGGPVYTVSNFRNTEYHTVVGICSGGLYDELTSTGSGTYGVRITSDLLRFYYYWEEGRIK